MRLLASVVFASALAVVLSAPAPAVDPPPPFRGYGTAVVDGALNLSEWEGAYRFPMRVDISPSADSDTVPATFYEMNDATNLYFALRISVPTIGDSALDGIFMAPPPDVFGAGSNLFRVTPGGLEDQFFHLVSPNYWDYLDDVADGGTNDGTSVVRAADGEVVFEMSLPLDDEDNVHDLSLAVPSHVDFTGVFQYCLGYCDASYIPWSAGVRIVIVSGTHVPPETRFTFGPADGAEVAAYGQFGFAGVDDVAPPSELTYECQIDYGDWRACESPLGRAAIEDGWHTISVRALDEMLNVDPTPATRHWRIDTQEPSRPKVVVTRRPGGSRMELGISATDRGTEPWRIRFRCKVDAKPFHACSSRYRLRLRSGRHVLRFNALDPAGNRSFVKIVRLVVH